MEKHSEGILIYAGVSVVNSHIVLSALESGHLPQLRLLAVIYTLVTEYTP